MKGIEKSSADLVLAEKQISVLGVQKGETEKFKKDYEAYKPDLEKIDSMFIDPENPVDFISFLEDTAGSSKIDSKISLPQSSQNYQGAEAGIAQDFIIFQISSKGSFPAVLDFVKQIETGPYLVEVQNLTIQNSQEQKNAKEDYYSRSVDADFSIEAFIKK